jgi:hypothetical protein
VAASKPSNLRLAARNDGIASRIKGCGEGQGTGEHQEHEDGVDQQAGNHGDLKDFERHCGVVALKQKLTGKQRHGYGD